MSDTETTTTHTEWTVYVENGEYGAFVAATGIKRYETVEGWLKAVQDNPGFIRASVGETTVTTTRSAERSIAHIESGSEVHK